MSCILKNRLSFAVVVFAVLTMAATAGATPISISEDFNDFALDSNLQDADSAYSFATGAAKLTVDDARHYIRTVGTDYNTVDFVAEVTFNIAAAGGGYPFMFFGIGDGVPNATAWGEPTRALVFVDSAGGGLTFKKNKDGVESAVYALTTPTTQAPASPTTGRIRMTKTGDSLMFDYDTAYDGIFSANYSYSVGFNALAAGLLTDTNSRIFFGTGKTLNSFDNFTVTVVPEPGMVAMLATGLLGLLCYAWRKRR